MPVFFELESRFPKNKFVYVEHREWSIRKINGNVILPRNSISRPDRKFFYKHKYFLIIDAFRFLIWFTKLCYEYKPKSIYANGGSLHFSLMNIIANLLRIPVIVIQPCILDYKNRNDRESFFSKLVSCCFNFLFHVQVSSTKILFGTNSRKNYIILFDKNFASNYKYFQNKTKLIYLREGLVTKKMDGIKFLICFESFNEFKNRYGVNEIEHFISVLINIQNRFGDFLVFRTHPRVPNDRSILMKLFSFTELKLDESEFINYRDYSHIVAVNSTVLIHSLLRGIVPINLIISMSQDNIEICSNNKKVINLGVDLLYDFIVDLVGNIKVVE